MATDDLMPLITAERRAFTGALQGLSEPQWNAPSLCEGWRVREVVAHMTMLYSYSTPRFLGQMVRSGGNFARMADRVARHDARAPIGRLLEEWRANEANPSAPPGGGLQGALTHDVVHGMDVTVPLGIEHPVSERALRVVLDNATSPRSRKHFGLDLTGIRLEAGDLDWAYGEGEPLRGSARSLLLVLAARRLPTGLLSGAGAARFTGG